MDSDKVSAQVERPEVVEIDRRRRRSGDEKLRIVLDSLHGPRSCGDGAAIRPIALLAAPTATAVSVRAEEAAE
jgi:hypothetical protein